MPDPLGILAEQAVARCRALASNQELPVNPFRIARELGAEVVEHPLEAGEAMLVRAGGRLAIVVEPSLFSSPTRRTRLRFTLAHELAHLVLDEVAASSPRGPVYIEYSQRERLCNLLASNLLIPRDCLISCLQETQTDPEVWRGGGLGHGPTLVGFCRGVQGSFPAPSGAGGGDSPRTAGVGLERGLSPLAGGGGGG